ncbi:MAG: hypothetical protein CMH26_01630 [Micavibrio sp.]|nr:hypothetical protein [Micavibrio sp.]
MGARIVTFILTLPFDRLGFLGELLQRYFEGIISNELIGNAEDFMRQYWIVKQKAEYIMGQRDIVFAQLQRAAEELEEAEQRFKECMDEFD